MSATHSGSTSVLDGSLCGLSHLRECVPLRSTTASKSKFTSKLLMSPCPALLFLGRGEHEDQLARRLVEPRVPFAPGEGRRRIHQRKRIGPGPEILKDGQSFSGFGARYGFGQKRKKPRS